MKLFKIEFNDLYVEAETEEQANETLYDYLATISANDLESETIETDAWRPGCCPGNGPAHRRRYRYRRRH